MDSSGSDSYFCHRHNSVFLFQVDDFHALGGSPHRPDLFCLYSYHFAHLGDKEQLIFQYSRHAYGIADFLVYFKIQDALPPSSVSRI